MRRAQAAGVVAALCAMSVMAHATKPTAPTPTAAKPAAQDVTARNAWARATAPGMTVGAAYLTLQGGTQDDQLVGARTERASMTQIHVVSEAAGMAQMRETEAVDVPAGRAVQLKPQGTHVMLMGLKQPLVAGERFRLTLQFAKAGPREVDVQVVAPGAEPPPSR
jgi:periplasmic copper chaperone A